MHRRSRRLLSTLVFAGAAVSVHVSVHAAELGEAKVASHIGQQLVADIELAMIEDPAAPVGVRLADREVYNGAGIAMPAVLSSLNLSVMRRDGRQFLHVTSLRPVESEHLHLYLELSDKGQRVVRLATLWLTPDPNPAPPPAPAPAAAPAPVPAKAAQPAAVPASRPAPVVAQPGRPAAARPRPAPVSPAPAVAAAPKKPAPAPHVDSQPAACVRAPEEAQACVALGAKNAALREQLGRLEDKVKGLQASLGAAPAPVPAPAHEAVAGAAEANPAAAEGHASAGKQEEAAAPPPPPRPAGPKPISAIKPLVPHKPKAPPAEEGGLPWGWIGAGLAVLAAAGGGAAVVLRRRARSRNVDIPDEPGVFGRLRQRFAAHTGAAKPAPETASEPTLE
jgi:hypothetical protein